MRHHSPRRARFAATAILAALACCLLAWTPSMQGARQPGDKVEQDRNTSAPGPSITDIKTPSGLEGNRAKVYLLQNFKIEGKNFSPAPSKNKVILIRTDRRAGERDYDNKTEAVNARRLVLTPLAATPTLLTVQIPGDAEAGNYKVSVEVSVQYRGVTRSYTAEAPRGLIVAMPNIKIDVRKLESVTPNVAPRGGRVELRGSFAPSSKIVFEPFNSTYEGAELQPGSFVADPAEADKTRIAFDVPADIPLANYRLSVASSNFKSRTDRLNFGVTPAGRLKLTLVRIDCLNEADGPGADEVYVVVVGCPRNGGWPCFALQTPVFQDVEEGESVSIGLEIDHFVDTIVGGQTTIKSVLGDRLENYSFVVGIGEHDGGNVQVANQVLSKLAIDPSSSDNAMEGQLRKAIQAHDDNVLGVVRLSISEGEANSAFTEGSLLKKGTLTGNGAAYEVVFRVYPSA